MSSARASVTLRLDVVRIALHSRFAHRDAPLEQPQRFVAHAAIRQHRGHVREIDRHVELRVPDPPDPPPAFARRSPSRAGNATPPGRIASCPPDQPPMYLLTRATLRWRSTSSGFSARSAVEDPARGLPERERFEAACPIQAPARSAPMPGGAGRRNHLARMRPALPLPSARCVWDASARSLLPRVASMSPIRMWSFASSLHAW